MSRLEKYREVIKKSTFFIKIEETLLPENVTVFKMTDKDGVVWRRHFFE